MTEIWHRVGDIDDVSENLPLAALVDDTAIGIFLVDGVLHAIENVCPHAFALLTDGYVEGDAIECPLHQAVFRIPTGECLREPADRDLATYPVRVEDGAILVRV